MLFNKTLNPHFITGMAELGGSFTYSQSRGGVTMYFALKSYSSDLSLLLKVQDFFKAGKIYKGGKGKDTWVYYRVNKLGELIGVVRHFEQYPLIGAKQHIFEIWKEMIICKRRKLAKDKDRLQSLALRLSKKTGKLY